MNACPTCERAIPEDLPQHRVVLEIEDKTRSTTQLAGTETPFERYCLNGEICPKCWEDLRKRLS